MISVWGSMVQKMDRGNAVPFRVRTSPQQQRHRGAMVHLSPTCWGRCPPGTTRPQGLAELLQACRWQFARTHPRPRCLQSLGHTGDRGDSQLRTRTEGSHTGSGPQTPAHKHLLNNAGLGDTYPHVLSNTKQSTTSIARNFWPLSPIPHCAHVPAPGTRRCAEAEHTATMAWAVVAAARNTT